MNSPYGLPIVDNCIDCPLLKSGFFCDVSPELKRELASVSHINTFPQHSILVVEGHPVKGVFVICSGQVKLSSTSREGKTVIIRVAKAGEVLGLSAVISGDLQQTTVETLTPCMTRFISQQDFVRLVHENAELSMRVAHALSNEFHAACREIRALALAPSTASRFASLVVSWLPRGKADRKGAELRVTTGFTHEQMAEMIGTSRETVTRIISDFKRDHIIDVKGATFVVRNRPALELLAV
jgi:CRP/FNR family transcriptional regulator